MNASGFDSPEARLTSFWLPPDTRGNGLSAARWAEIVEVSPGRAEELLRALADSQIPARVGPVPRTPASDSLEMGVWVDPDRYGQAENVLLREMSRDLPDEPGLVATDVDCSPVSWLEVKQLWWFSDGAIMADSTRTHLWQARGLCSRHSWLFFCAECELKYQPLGVTILYEDLVGRALRVLRRHRGDRGRKHGLEARASCLTCDYVAAASGDNPAFLAERDQVEAAVRTRAWVRASSAVWRARVCPRCLPDHENPAGMLCRQHLISSRSHDDTARTVDYLDELGPRLHRCVRSMTYDGPERCADSDAALVEAIGWFAGWHGSAAYRGPRRG